ncbi:MAG TPA: TolC family protein [Nannocystaceae bacterium]|nr:TolC family protein [Nannocystaceae bacterium]
MRRVLVLALVLGCATSPEKARREAAKLAGDRLERRVAWESGSDADREVERRVQELLSRELTADAAVEIALVRNPTLLADLENLGIAQADLVAAGLLDNLHFGGGPRFPLGAPTPAAYEFDAAFFFIRALVIPLRKKVAKAQLREAVLRIAHDVIALDTHVREAVFDAIAAERTLELRTGIAELAEAAAELARRQTATGAAGTMNELERSEIEAAEAEARTALQLAHVDVVEAREHLVRELGIFGDDVQFRLPKMLPKLPEREPELAQLERIAMRQRYDLQAQRAELDAIAGAVKLARRNPFVQVDVGIIGENDPDDPASLGPFFELELPIFNWGQAEIARSEAMLRQVERRLRGRAVEVRSEVRVQRAKLVAQRRLAEYERDRVVPMRMQMVKLGQERYDAMLFSVYELIELKMHELQARAELVEHLHDYFHARAELELAIGGRLESSIARFADRKDK